MKPRPLRRILQEQTRFLFNQDSPEAWQAYLLRIPPDTKDHFILKKQEPWPFKDEDCRVVFPQNSNRVRSIHVMGDRIPLFAYTRAEYPGQLAALLLARTPELLAKLKNAVSLEFIPAEAPDAETAQPSEAFDSATLHDEEDSIDELAEPDPQPEKEDANQETEEPFESSLSEKALAAWESFSETDPDLVELSREIEQGQPSVFFTPQYQIISSSFDFKDFSAISFEPRGALAEWTGHYLLVWCSTSWPHQVRRCISEATGVAQRHIRVYSLPSQFLPDRFMLDTCLLASWAAMAALSIQGKIRLFTNPREDALYGTREGQSSILIQSAHDEDGRLLALRSKIQIDTGAYPCASRETLQMNLLGLCSQYRCEHQSHEAKLIRSSNPPRFPSNLLGMTHSIQALEQHIELICRNYSLDAIQWRSSHLLQKGDLCPYGQYAENNTIPRLVLNSINIKSDYSRLHASLELWNKQLQLGNPKLKNPLVLKGCGLALSFQSHGLILSSELDYRARLALELTDDGHLTIQAPIHTLNSGIREAWLQGVEEMLGVEERNISFAPFSSEDLEDTGPARFSRLASLYSPLLVSACQSLKRKIRSGKGPFFTRSTWVQQKQLVWDEESFTGTPFLGKSWAAAHVLLSLDKVDLQVRVEAVWISIHAGSILHPQKASSHIRQAVLLCLDWLTNQTLSFEDPESDQFWSLSYYQAKPPAIHVMLENQEESASKRHTLAHAGALGELVQACVPGAFNNALAQILGTLPSSTPLENQELEQFLYKKEE